MTALQGLLSSIVLCQCRTIVPIVLCQCTSGQRLALLADQCIEVVECNRRTMPQNTGAGRKVAEVTRRGQPRGNELKETT